MRKIAGIILLASLIIGLCACGGEHRNTIQIDTDKTTESPVSGETSEETEDIAIPREEQIAVTPATSLADESLQAYERFVNHDENIYFDLYSVAGAVPQTAYSFSDYLALRTDLNASENYYEIYSVKEQSYAYIDCGNDGVLELSIALTAEGAMSEMEGDYYFVDVFKYIDGKIQFLYEICEHYRGYSYINKYGIIVSGMVDFAGANIYTDIALIDKDGNFSYILGETESTGEAIAGMYMGYDGPNLTDTFPGEDDLYNRVYVYKLYIYEGNENVNNLYSYRIVDASLPEENLIDDFNNSYNPIEWDYYDEYQAKKRKIYDGYGLTEEMVLSTTPEYVSF